jgi:hypothetical protein
MWLVIYLNLKVMLISGIPYEESLTVIIIIMLVAHFHNLLTSPLNLTLRKEIFNARSFVSI